MAESGECLLQGATYRRPGNDASAGKNGALINSQNFFLASNFINPRSCMLYVEGIFPDRLFIVLNHAHNLQVREVIDIPRSEKLLQ